MAGRWKHTGQLHNVNASNLNVNGHHHGDLGLGVHGVLGIGVLHVHVHVRSMYGHGVGHSSIGHVHNFLGLGVVHSVIGLDVGRTHLLDLGVHELPVLYPGHLQHLQSTVGEVYM